MRIRTLLTAAILLAGPVSAAEADNPACNLLTEDEVHTALGAEATESVINPEMTGVSDCGWTAKNDTSMAINRAAGLAFQGSSTAEDSYRNWRDGYAGVEDIKGIGDKAFLFTDGPDGTRYIVGILKAGTVVILHTRGVSRPATMRLAARAAGRI